MKKMGAIVELFMILLLAYGNKAGATIVTAVVVPEGIVFAGDSRTLRFDSCRYNEWF